MQDLRLVILAGGKARRMNGENKGLMQLARRSLIEHVVCRVGADFHTQNIYLNLNHNLVDYAETIQKLQLNPHVIHDLAQDYQGPLAGILASLNYFKNTADKVNFVLFCPCDSPFLPLDLALKLYQAAITNKAEVAVANSPNGWQNSCCLVSLNCINALEKALENNQLRISAFLKSQKFIAVDFADSNNFFNINNTQDLTQAQQMLHYFNISEKG